MHFVYLLIVVSLLLCLVNIGGWVCWPHVNISSAQYHLRGLLYDLELQSKTHGLTYWITSQVGSSGDLLPHVTDVHVVMLAHDLDTLNHYYPSSHWTCAGGSARVHITPSTANSDVTSADMMYTCVGYHRGHIVWVSTLRDTLLTPSVPSVQRLQVLYPLATVVPFILCVFWILFT